MVCACFRIFMRIGDETARTGGQLTARWLRFKSREYPSYVSATGCRVCCGDLCSMPHAHACLHSRVRLHACLSLQSCVPCAAVAMVNVQALSTHAVPWQLMFVHDYNGYGRNSIHNVRRSKHEMNLCCCHAVVILYGTLSFEVYQNNCACHDT
jgi:hypothetical protein